MHLKSLTLKGFKSFASSTTLRFEPGITAVVGPNGSGKSNVVDAIAWVLGEQGAKALRGGRMDDVIFAGTAHRPPLGRAEVTLTIDNRDRALPSPHDEISITRRMFRDGAGEYEINGKACRLLDIQELLSDSGIGREMHVIVGQGHLDSVLSARPEDRRAFIEEAAGVLKHRKRKEKALRKLDAMAANLTRLTDLTGELRRQLGPLGRQAEIARRAAGVQAELRDARLRLLAHDAADLLADIGADSAAEQDAVEHRERIQAALAEARAQQGTSAEQLASATPRVDAAARAHLALSALAERFRGMTQLARERAAHLSSPVAAPPPGRDPAELRAEAERLEAEQADKERQVVTARAELDEVIATRSRWEDRLAVAEQELLAASRAIADRREGLARLSGQVNTARSRLAANEEEIVRLATAIAEAGERAQRAQSEFEELRSSVGDLDSSELGLDEAHEAAAAASETARQRVQDLTETLHGVRAERASLRARAEALALGLDRRDAAATLLSGDRPGILGSVATLVQIRAGAEAPIAAALGDAADAVAVADLSAAAAALQVLREDEGGRVGLLVGVTDPHVSPVGQAPAGSQWARDLVDAPDPLRPSLDRLLAGVVVVDDADRARQVVAGYPDLTAVTRDGDLFSATWVVGGSSAQRSTIEIRAAVEDAHSRLGQVTARLADLEADLERARADAQQRDRAAADALAALYESDARISAVTEQLAGLGGAARAAEAEAERLSQRRVDAERIQQQLRQEVRELEARWAAAQDEPTPDQIDPTRRDDLAARVDAARRTEVEARLALRTAEERARATSGAAERLRRSAQEEAQARARAERAAVQRVAHAALAARIATVADEVAQRLTVSVAAAQATRAAAEADRTAAERSAETARSRLADLQREWDHLTDAVHATEMLRAQRRMRLDQLAETAREEYGVILDELVAEYGPDVPVPPSAVETAEYEQAKSRGEQVSAPIAMPYDRASVERRATRAQRDLNTLGRVNPLALEEYAAMEERHAFLATQLEDLRSTRADLLDVIAEVDEKILELFTSAYHDVAAEFAVVFETLFPGGEGELHLTDPDDMLTTGIEVTARPPGKRVKRLSLLSGGERSLVAVAMLVAIFRARPSPFYVLDEVEAALDEVNLTRLIGLLRDLRNSSQLLVITHQKYTMEAADVLYGVSMRGDGISEVISQRLRDGKMHTETVTLPADRVAADEDAAGAARPVTVGAPDVPPT